MTTILAKDEHDLAEHDRDSGLVILDMIMIMADHDHVLQNDHGPSQRRT